MNHYTLHVLTPAAPHEIHVPRNNHQSLADILRHHGLPLNVRCGQRGLCEGCLLELHKGSIQHLRREETLDAATPLEIRGCDYRPLSDLTLHVPQRSLVSYTPQILDGYAIRIPYARDPLSHTPLGLAIDIGTTTVAVMLVDLTTAKVLTRGTAFNAQMHFGDDVVTRISLCMQDPAMLRRLQESIIDSTLTPLIDDALKRAERTGDDIGAITVAGNTTMLHILAGVDPSPLGVSPFTPRFTEYRILPAQPLFGKGRSKLPNALLHLLPSATAYIGADIVAGLVSTGMAYESTTALLVDIGTNGEIVLRKDDQLLGCATAAGPAFEGARLSSGMRAGDGTITAIRLTPHAPNHHLEWIGQANRRHPTGLCGSAYIDFLAEGRRTGLLSTTGRFLRDTEHDSHWQLNGSSAAYCVALGQGKRPIVVTDCDVASLLSAKAAIAAGITLLLEHAHIQPADVQHLYLAGGFGTHMNAANAIAIGLLPGFTKKQIIPVGNTSLAGAYLALTDQSLLLDMSKCARQVSTLELNLLPTFQDTYIDALSLP